MRRNQQFARVLFALGMVSLGILALVYGDLALVWYSVPAWVPWREGVAFASGLVMLGGGAGFLVKRTAPLSSRAPLPYLLLLLLLGVPAFSAAPLTRTNLRNAGGLC